MTPVVAPKPPVMHIDPYEAAKEIRTLSRELMQGDVNQSNVTLTRARSRLGDVQSYLQRIEAHIELLEQAIKNRKPLERTKEINAIRSSLSYASTRTSSAQDLVSALVSPAAPDKSTVSRIHKLAQALPTTKENSLTPAENVLRSIVVVLANNGYAKRED